jgi:hypothetical protein
LKSATTSELPSQDCAQRAALKAGVRAALKRLDAQNEDQAHEANHCEGRDGKADGAFKQHLVPSWEVIAWVGVFNG